MTDALPPAGVLDAVVGVLDWPDLDRVRATRLGGGCIHPAARLEHPAPGTGAPGSAFIKWTEAAAGAGAPESDPGVRGDATPAPPFQVEAAGLRMLRERGGPRIPRVLGHDPGSAVCGGWLLLEYLEPVSAPPGDSDRLGRELARLHRPLDAPPGLESDGWIATLPQDNRRRTSWAEFWRDARLVPQIERAAPLLGSDLRNRLDRVLDAVPAALADVADRSLLHGDLWGGNVLFTREGPALVDPAPYRGHREVDLAMMELFGGFDRECLSAYREVAPLQPGYPESRRPLYQLYPMLVHVNLFGTGYRARTDRAARDFLEGV